MVIASEVKVNIKLTGATEASFKKINSQMVEMVSNQTKLNALLEKTFNLQKAWNVELGESLKLQKKLVDERVAGIKAATSAEKEYNKVASENPNGSSTPRNPSSNNNRSWSKGLGVGGHLLQAGGLFQFGHLFRAAGVLTDALGGSAVAAIGVTSALAVFGGGVILVKKIVENFGGAFASAIGSLGNARTLEQMIVNSVHTETSAAQIAGASTDHSTSAEVLKLIKETSFNSQFSQEKVGEWINSYRQRTGQVKSFENLTGVAKGLATNGVENPGDLLGRIRAAFPDITDDRLGLTAKKLWGLSRFGGFDLNDSGAVESSLKEATAVRRDPATGIALNSGIAALLTKSGVSGAGGVVTRVEQNLLDKPDKFGFLGNYTKEDPVEGRRFTNIENSISRLAVKALDKPESLKGVESRQDIVALRALAEQSKSQFTPGMSEEQKAAIIEANINAIQNTTEDLIAFDKSVKDMNDTTENQLKTVFNNLELILGESLTKVVKDLTPVLKDMLDELAAHPEDIKTFFKNITEIGKGLAWLTEKIGVPAVTGTVGALDAVGHTIKDVNASPERSVQIIEDRITQAIIDGFHYLTSSSPPIQKVQVVNPDEFPKPTTPLFPAPMTYSDGSNQ